MFDIIQLAGRSPAFPIEPKGGARSCLRNPFPAAGQTAISRSRLRRMVSRSGMPPRTCSGCLTTLSQAGTTDPAEVDVAGLAEGGPVDTMAPGAVLAAVAEMACDPAVVTALSD